MKFVSQGWIFFAINCILTAFGSAVREQPVPEKMPEIPELKSRIDFGARESFADCGFLPRRRSKRDNAKVRGSGLIVGGQSAAAGQHPWHASLSLEEIHDFCGATLISKTTLVAAAHCLYREAGIPILASELEVTLGMHSALERFETSQQKLQVSRILLHPGYNHSNHRNDLALIVLQNEVQFTNFVRPICLWNSDYDLDKIVNKTGTVVGWGFTANHTQPEFLQEAQIKVVSYQECFESNKFFFSKFLHPREHFCAGIPQNQRGACSGDGGSGFYLTNSGRHFLRGVVSMGRSKRVITEDNYQIFTCNPNYYVLYTDVTNYMRWIVDNTPDLNA
ncbi:coagulation factor IX-like [Neocloeon triangulifer]|uniref:coagulation factor IX-like n=1 Tax=Neocloeon triangulifer TaxID=2078957 RepID=UPI00286F7781|nr:coagulation factor IX-like [Neocloeon triangulifer]